MAGWFRHDIAAWMDGTEGLSDGQYRVYHVVCQLMYLNEGPIRLNEAGIAGRCNQHVLAFRNNLVALMEARKLFWVDGKISNPRAETELKRLTAPRKPKANPQPTPSQPQLDPPTTPATPPPDGHCKPLKNNKAQPELSLQTRLDETRQEEDAADAAPIDLKKQFYDRAKQVLGPSGGGMATNLLKAKWEDIAQARGALEVASTKSNPRQYIAGIVRASEPRSPII